MDTLNYYLTDHWGGSPQGTDIVLYEITWNNYGFHGMFEFQIRNQVKYEIKGTHMLDICRIDGTMKKRHELRSIYSPSDKCFTQLSNGIYISFPSKSLCLTLLLNYTAEQRKEIAKKLCFNYGEGIDFEMFKKTEQYKVSILRNFSEEKFLSGLKECKKMMQSELDLTILLDRDDISIK